MQINVTFDSSVSSAPAAFKTDVLAVAAYYDTELTNTTTVDISVGYGEIAGQTVSDGGGESQAFYNDYSYSAVRAALIAHATSAADAKAVATLPTIAPAGFTTISIPEAEADLLGLSSGVASAEAGFSATAAWNYSQTNQAVSGELDFTGVVEHEFSEILGRVSDVGDTDASVMDLFRYSAAGTRTLVAGQTAYFSIDGGVTNLDNFNTVAGGDYGDWASSAGNDAYDAFSSYGRANTISATDLTLLDVLGYTLAETSSVAAAPPVIAGTVAGQTVLTTGSVAPFAGVTITDPNVGETETLTVTLSAAGAGTLSNLAGGSFTAATGVYSIAGALAAVQTALDGLIFTPAATTTGFTITVNDTLASATDTKTTVIASAAGVPVISGSVGGQAVASGGSLAPFAAVSLSDPNAGRTETATVTFTPATGGSLSNLAGGSYTSASGTYSVSGSLAAVQSALDGLIFRPRLAGTTATTAFALTLNDGLQSTTNTQTSVIAAAAPAPSISGAVGAQTIAATGALAPFAGMALADTNAGVSETLSVTLSPATSGSLSNLAGGTYSAATGSYSVAGSLDAVQAALQGLVFAPSVTATKPGSTTTTSFSVTLNDGVAAAATNTATTVIATNQQSALPDVSASLSPIGRAALQQALAGLPGSAPANVVTTSSGATTVPAFSGLLNALVVSAAGAGAAVTVPSGYRADYLLGSAGTSLGDSNGSTLLVGTAANATLFGAANDTIIGGNAGATLIAGAGAETIVGGTGANLLSLGAGTSAVTSQGTDTITGGSSAATITASANALVFGGTGAADFIGTGGAPTLVGGAAETVSGGAATPLVFGGAGPLSFVQGSGAATVVGGANASVSLSGGSAKLLFFGNGPATYTAGSAADTILGGTGSLTATGGSTGALFFGGTAGNNALGTGPGSATIIGGGAGDVLTATGTGTNVIGASGGAETINGAASTGRNSFFAGNGADCIVGGAGQTAIVAGAGNDTLVAGTGATLIQIFAGFPGRTDVIAGFTPGTDFLSLPGYASGAGAAALATAATASASTTIALPDGTHVTFQGVTGLTASIFV